MRVDHTSSRSTQSILIEIKIIINKSFRQKYWAKLLLNILIEVQKIYVSGYKSSGGQKSISQRN